MSLVEVYEDPLFVLVSEMQRLGLENTQGVERYYSIYLAEVVEVGLQGQGLIKVIVGATGQSDPLSHFARPSSPLAGPDYGFYSPPEPGDVGWIAFDHGDKNAIPRYLGSFWKRRRDDQDPANSEVPAEFKNAGAPKVRGFKTPRGSGWRFSDEEDTPFFEVWMGTQGDPGTAAAQEHLFRMDMNPDDQQVRLSTSAGHFLQMIDAPTATQKIILQSILGSSLTFDDEAEQVVLQTPGGMILSMDDVNSIMRVISTGQLVVQAASTVQTIFGPAELQYQGTLDVTAQQLATYNYLAGLIANVTGIMSLGGLATSVATFSAAGVGISVALGFVSIGLITVANFFRLMTENFIPLYNGNVGIANANTVVFGGHVHPFVGLAAGSPGFTLPTTSEFGVQAPVDPNNVTTQTMRGN